MRVSSDDVITVVPSRDGRGPDLEAAYPQLLSILESSQDLRIRLPSKTLPPKRSTKDVESMGVDSLLAQFTVNFDHSSANRVQNITLATKAFDGLFVAPGQVISFNEVVGPRSAEAGYREAPTIIENKFVDTVGEGICRVSSTLYNAVLLAGLKIVERHNHALPVGYVPLGRDATVFYGYLDFKFQNNTEKYLYLRAVVGPDYITIKIYGHHLYKRPVEIRTWVTEVIPFKVIRKEDPGLERGKVVVEQKGQEGYRVRGERIIGGSKEALPESLYIPVEEIIRMGTKEVPTPPQPGKSSGSEAPSGSSSEEQRDGIPQSPKPQTGEKPSEGHPSGKPPAGSSSGTQPQPEEEGVSQDGGKPPGQ
ncbi:MAG TPA: hypothetical protein ENM97_01425 [Moorella mulderi]|nr:hypothetical protein [Moorella mulderi]